MSRLPGLDSYRGRYAYFALIAGLVLIVVAYLGWDYVKRSSSKQIAQIEARSMVAGVLSDALTHLNLVENSLQGIIIEPGIKELENVDTRIMRLHLTLQKLEQVLNGNSDPNAVVAKELRQDAGRLEEVGRDLISIRTDVERWFPTLRLLREEMFPHNQQLLSLLEGLSLESEELTIEDRLMALKTAASLRSAWLNMISEMRLFVANRFGIFSNEFHTGMDSCLTNIIYYEEGISNDLKTLNNMASAGRLGFVAATSLEDMEEHSQAWMRAFNQLVRILDNPNWRMDLLLMGEAISPILDRMRQRISTLDMDLDTQSAQDITQLTEITRQLSKSIFGLSAAGIVMILFVYLFLHRNLLRPIAETALALKQEAQGQVDIEPPAGNLKETRDLVDAFTEMRRQVHTRQRSLDHMAHHDALTQLPNRVLFHDRLKHALEIADRSNYLVGVMFLDLDRFKHVNDSLGHLVGDELLKTVAQRLNSLVRTSDTVARLSGDEFSILVEGLEEQDDLIPLAENILAILHEPIQIAAHELHITASIGIAIAPFDDVSAEHLIRDADTAMYEAKRQGRAVYRFFSDDMTYQATESLNLEYEVRQAVELKQFIYYFQPVYCLNGRNLNSCEALLRWQHPEKGLLLPEVFLDVLNSTGLISELMDDLLDQAGAYQKQISQDFGRNISVSVNLSVRLLNDPIFCRGVLERLIAGEFADAGLVLEITEDILTQELAEADIFLQQVKALGGRIALDDFGTGQASLSHLRQFPFDILKIDRAFIQSVDIDPNDASLVEAIIKMSHAFNMPVIAEGVETETQREFVRGLGCDYIQGHLVGMPTGSVQVNGCI